MNNYSILSHSLYHIDIEKESIELDNLEKGKAEEYVKSIIQKSLYAKNIRYYKIKRETTEVVGLVSALIKEFATRVDSDVAATVEEEGSENEIDSISGLIAERLLNEEIKTQEKILRMNREIRKGSVIQSILRNDEGKEYFYIIAKVEHVNILDKKDWQEHTGLPLEKEILKTCVISYDENCNINEIKIYDTNSSISKYWYDDFLELEPFTTDEDNTKKSFKEIDKILYNNIKRKSPTDYNLLRNSLIGYYNQNKKFDFDDLKGKVFKNYKPQNTEDVDIEKVIRKLENVIGKERFDKQFEIVPEAIRKNKIKIYKIHEDIDLTIKDNIDNLSDVIKADKTIDEFYLRILIDEKTYNEFNYK